MYPYLLINKLFCICKVNDHANSVIAFNNSRFYLREIIINKL